MRNSFILLLILFFTSLSSLAQDANFHIYLCFGQSNMEGSAPVEEQDKVADPRFQVMRAMDCPDIKGKKESWQTANPPLSQCWQGLSPADYFGRTMVENLPEHIKIGVINVAIGGCDIRLFDRAQYQQFTDTYPEAWFGEKIEVFGGNPYERLIQLAKMAQKDGLIKGVLLHQGETNTGDVQWPQYVKTVYDNMLEDLALKASEVPLLAGEVVHADQNGQCAAMNPIINQLPETIPTAHVISSSGCTVQEDLVHFDSEGVRTLGKRYARKMLGILKEQGFKGL
ncbi:sialate O-acetylesterase [Persicobacter diffluens]|uniref:Acetylxylan esterase n=1 Tax=Persicobacter diffluens TaxID=981 RepID=A0AAN4W1Z4_9BACT|nr:acetylxylan esterase [Persicobacter diffluens]